LLRLVQSKVADSVDRMPRYMCTQTIDRSQYEPDIPNSSTRCGEGPTEGLKTHLTTADRLRLDVGIGATSEIYSRVVENRFNDRDLLDVVREGAISTGSFAAFLTAIFRTDAADFTYHRETTLNGRSVAEFGFRVLYKRSHYLYDSGQHRVVTGYGGTFLVDRQTADLVRLTIRTSQLPKETGACYASTTLDYGRVRLKGADFLLPAESLLQIVVNGGGEDVNRTVFSGCHEFLGESSITFDPPSQHAVAVDADDSAASKVPLIPKGLHFRAALAQVIDTRTAAGGDPVKATLLTPLQDGKKVFAPAGAAVAARILRIRRYYGRSPELQLDIRLETVDAGGDSIPLEAEPDTGPSFENRQAKLLRVELGSLRGLEDRSAAFIFRGIPDSYVVGRGLESAWVTIVPPAGGADSLPGR